MIPVVPSAVKIDEMVGKTSQVDYQFPDNDNDSDKAEVRYSIHFNLLAHFAYQWAFGKKFFFQIYYFYVSLAFKFNSIFGDGAKLIHFCSIKC